MKIEKTTRVDDAYNKIKTEITENRMTPANPMLEQEIAENLSMSRTPVREALLRLESEGLLEIVPRKGVKILPISQEDMREIYEIFISLEPIVAEGLAKRKGLSKENFEDLEQTINDMEDALNVNDLDSWAVADLKFHQRLVELYGNKRLINILDMLRNQTHRVRLLTRNFRKKPTQSAADHRLILKYIYEGESDKAYKAFKRHRERTAKELLALLDKLQFSSI